MGARNRIGWAFLWMGVGLGWGAWLPLAVAEEKHALLVGVNDYEKRGFRTLGYAERDVSELGKLLARQGFSVQVLLGSVEGTEEARKERIEAAINKLLENRKETEIIILGFAGHGVQLPLRDEKGYKQKDSAGNELEEAYYCPKDAVQGESETMIGLTGLLKKLDRRGGINLVLVDACRDNRDPGRSSRSITGNELNGRLPSNTAIVFSCAAGQQALETKDAGGGHGVFFYHVLEGLRGEAANRRGDVTWDSLVGYVKENVNDRAKEWFPERIEKEMRGRLQTPHELRNLIDNPRLARTRIEMEEKPKPDGFVGTRAGEERTISGIKFCWIPAGSFTMGSPPDEKDRGNDENQVQVTLSRGFWMGQYETTQAEYERVMGKNPSYFSASRVGNNKVAGLDSSRFPVEQVSWNDAIEYCEKLTAQAHSRRELPHNWKYTLPTEAQWEYGCRAGTTTPFHFGEILNGKQANMYGIFPYGTAEKGPGLLMTARSGSYPANAWNLHDMHGNVREWCQDYYKHGVAGGVDPLGQGNTLNRIVRGGGWLSLGKECRAGERWRHESIYRHGEIGFRLVAVPAK